MQSIAQTKDVTGIWEGKLQANVTLHLVFHFQQVGDGKYKGTMDSPDQNAKNIPCSNITVNNDSVIVEISVAGISYKAILLGDSTMAGDFLQGGFVIPLQLQKVAKATEANRPQTPKPPFTYNSEDVEYDNADKTVHFGATFTYPKTGGKFATALLITGSGQQDRDETIFEHKPFAVIADYLTKKGYAVLRVDDRGMGKTKGSLKNATSEDFAKDAMASLQYLHTRKEVDIKKIGLIGHSEGALIADIIAAQDKSINFVIMLGGPGLVGKDLMALQNQAYLESNGISTMAATAYKELYTQLADIALKDSTREEANAEAWDHFISWKDKQIAPVLSDLNFNDTTADKKQIMGLVQSFRIPWYRFFMQADPSTYIQQFTCNVLALNGDKDIQVLPTENLAGIKAALLKSKSPNFSTEAMPGLNHLFQHCNICTIQEYSTIEETFAPEALDRMGAWLDKYVMH
jgi:alpha/beta superfamily hydrolase